jgi:hypothetical protein
MKPNEVIGAARAKLGKDTPLNTAVMEAWDKVCDQIQARAVARRPKMKVFEVHHETQVAKLALLTAIVEGRTPSAAQEAALRSVGL